MARSANGAYPHPDDAGPVAMIAQPTRVAEPLREFRVLRTRDPDEMCREVAGQLSAHRLELASRREFCATVNRVQLGATTLMHLAYGTPVRVTTDPLEDHVVLMLPIARPMRVEMKDRVTQTGPEAAVVVPRRCATRTAGGPELSSLVVRLGADDLARHLRRLAPHAGNRAPDFEPGRPLNPALIVGAVHALRHAFDLRPRGLPTLVVHELHRQLLTALLFGCRHNGLERLLSPPPMASRAKIRRAVELIEDAPHGDTSLEAVAEEAGLSLRALQEGFRRDIGLSPRAYLKRARLQRTRAALLGADPSGETTVTDLALAHGFTHLGRFAVEYREAFGETPSASLHKPHRDRR
jgi:AraC-like DNA-binding protein